MKLTNLFAALAGLCAFTAGTVRADVVQVLTLNITTYAQSVYLDNGTFSGAAPPRPNPNRTSDLLVTLANDERAAGVWTSTNNFPATAKLAGTDQGLAVIDGTNILVMVTNIMSLEEGGALLSFGKINDVTGLGASTVKHMHMAKITFDDTSITNSANLKFYVQGIWTDTQTDTVPKADGSYSETRSAKMTNAAGEGSINGTPFLLTAVVSTTGKGTKQLPQ
jgi:hypothetical protein